MEFQIGFQIGNPKGFEMEFEFKGIQMDWSKEIQMVLKMSLNIRIQMGPEMNLNIRIQMENEI